MVGDLDLRLKLCGCLGMGVEFRYFEERSLGKYNVNKISERRDY